MPGSSRGSCAVHRRHSSFLPLSRPRACLCSLVFKALHYKVNYDAWPVKPETALRCRRSGGPSWRSGLTVAHLLPATVLPRACLCSLWSKLFTTKLLTMRPVKPETSHRCQESSMSHWTDRCMRGKGDITTHISRPAPRLFRNNDAIPESRCMCWLGLPTIELKTFVIPTLSS